MITVFEHGINKFELKRLSIIHTTREEYIENNSTYTILADLAALFKLRGDHAKFKSYIKSVTSLLENKIVELERFY